MRRMFGVLAVVACLASACAAELDEEDLESADDQSGDVQIDGVSSALASPSFALISFTSQQAITGGTLTKGTLVTQTPFTNAKAQRWVFDGQTARLTPASDSSLCMEPESNAVSARIRLQKCEGFKANQGWKLRITALGGGVKAARFENLGTHQLLDNGGTLRTNAATTQFPENGTSNQLFERRF